MIAPAPPTAPPRAASTAAFRVEVKKIVDRYLGIPAQILLHALSLLSAPFTPTHTVGRVQRVLLVKLWGVGNLAMILPYVQALRRHFPEAEIGFLTLERNRALVESHPGVDQVLTVRDRGVLTPLYDLVCTVFRLRRWRVDLYLDFEQFLRISGLLGCLGGARQAIGFDTPHQYRARLYHARVPYGEDRHMAEVFGDVVRSAGAPVEGLPPFAVPRAPEAQRRAGKLLARAGPRPWIALHAGSGDNFPGRRWPVERFAEAGVELLRRRGGTLLLTGTPNEARLVEQLRESIDLQAPGRTVSLAGQLDLLDLIALIDKVDLVVSNDTGPVHLASATGTPVVALYGPNTPRLYGPLGPASRALYHRLPCSPCLTNQSGKTSSCRLPACILSIDVPEVVSAAEQVLDAVPVPREVSR